MDEKTTLQTGAFALLEICAGILYYLGMQEASITVAGIGLLVAPFKIPDKFMGLLSKK